MKRRKNTRPGYAVSPIPYRYTFPEDPVCVMGPGGTRCGGCHWDLRAKYGADYWLKGVTK